MAKLTASQPALSHVLFTPDLDAAYDMIILSDESWCNPDRTEIYILNDVGTDLSIPQMELIL